MTPVVAGVIFGQKIGDGGIADVWSGVWASPTGPQAVAIKVLRDPGRPNLRRRFVREGRILQRLHHPGLVRCLAIVNEEQPALILDLLEGESLDRALARGPLPAEQVYTLAHKLLETLIHLHDQGIVHRDLKASNVWLASDGRIVLVDLGLAIDPSDPLTSTLGEVVGTHAYMAPEQIAGARVDIRADLYALGITLYEALCGQRPYQARGLTGYLQAHRSGRAASISQRGVEVLPAFAAMVDRLLALDPADRPQSGSVALAHLAWARQGSSDEPMVVRTLASPRRAVGREAVRGAVLAALHGGALGEAGLVHLHGEVGSGLAAAAEQARQIAASEGVEHVTLRAKRGANTAWAVAELARTLDGWAGRVRATVPDVRVALAGLAGESLGGRRALLVIEDLADDGLAAFVVHLRRGVPELAVVTTGHTPGSGIPGAVTHLRPLTEGETAELVRALLGTPSEPLLLSAAIYAATGGQPGLAVLAVRRLAATGGLTLLGTSDDGTPRWHWNPAARPPPGPRSLRELRRLLTQLPPASRRLLTAVADLAQPTEIDEVEGTAKAPPDAVYPLLRLGLVTLDEDDRVSLRRPILNDALRGRASNPPRDRGVAALRRSWEGLARPTPPEAQALLEAKGTEADPEAASLAALTEAEALMLNGRSVPQRLLEVVRDLPPPFAADRAWILGTLALRQGDWSTARRRLERTLRLDPELSRRVTADAALSLIDVELRIGRRSDARIRSLALLQNRAFPELHRGMLQLRLAQHHAASLALRDALAMLHAARQTLKSDAALPAVELTWIDLLLRAGSFDEAEQRLGALSGAAAEDTPWAVRSRYALLLARARRLRRDPAAAYAAHVRGEDDAARAEDVPHRAFHAGMASALCGNLRAATQHAALLEAAGSGDLRSELLTVCARRARDARLYQLAEASARGCGDRSLLLSLLYSLRGPGARREAAELVADALQEVYSPLRAHFLELLEVQWARSSAG